MKRRLFKKKMKKLVMKEYNSGNMKANCILLSTGKLEDQSHPDVQKVMERNLSRLWQPRFKAERRRLRKKLNAFFPKNQTVQEFVDEIEAEKNETT